MGKKKDNIHFYTNKHHKLIKKINKHKSYKPSKYNVVDKIAIGLILSMVFFTLVIGVKNFIS